MTELISSLTNREKNFSVELDCPPGMPRPEDLIEGVLKDSGFEVSDFDTNPPFFGNQLWVLRVDANKDELFRQIRLDTIKPKVVELYELGAIRYGSW